MRSGSYFRVLTEAINDLLAHGFDSMARIDHWTAELRRAAEASMASPAVQEQMLKDYLASIYTKLVEQGQIATAHPGVARFTLEKIRPHLRAELDRRIMASANLIRLKRARAIDLTLQRFQGWATSIPLGGSDTGKRAKVKKEVRRAIAQQPFEVRRVLIDQGHKLSASINEVVARDGGAIALRWHSHWRQPGYDYRPDHKERDGQVYLIRDSWAQKAGLVKPGTAGYYDQVTAVAEEPFCRCQAVYIYAVRRLPEDMVTNKGRAALASAQGAMAA